jgi:hypothetical protein
MPPTWWQEAVFKGTLRVTREPADRAKKGIVSLEDATLATASAGSAGVAIDAGLILPVLYELLFLAAGSVALIPGLLRMRLKSESPNGGKA